MDCSGRGVRRCRGLAGTMRALSAFTLSLSACVNTNPSTSFTSRSLHTANALFSWPSGHTVMGKKYKNQTG